MKIMNWFTNLFSRRRVVLMGRENERPEAELSQCFLGASDLPVFQAVMEVLDNRIVDLGNDLLDPGLTTRRLDRAAAAQGALVDFKATLLDKVAYAARHSKSTENEPE